MELKYGCDNVGAVKELQAKLKALGLYTKRVDGDYGKYTRAAVVDFQRQNHLTVTGVADFETLDGLGLKHLGQEQMASLKPLELDDKIAMVEAISPFEGNFWSCNRDGEFEGVFDAPRKDTHGVSLAPENRRAWAEANGVAFDPNGYSKYGTDPGHVGLSWGFIQFTQNGGSLGAVLKTARERDSAVFDKVFGPSSVELVRVTNLPGAMKQVPDSASPTKVARRSPRVQPIGGVDLWKEPWVSRFVAAGRNVFFQGIQMEAAIGIYFDPMLERVAKVYNVKSQRGLTILMDRSVQLGVGGCATLMKTYFKSVPAGMTEQEMFETLYQKVKDRGWAHRLKTLLTCDSLSWNLVFDF